MASPSKGRFEIFTVFSGIDNITRPIKKMQSSMRRFARDIKVRFRGVISMFRTLGNVAKRTLQVGMVAGLFGVQRAIRSTISIAASFEQALVNAGARFGDGLRKGDALFKQLRDSARQVGRTTEITATQAARGLNFFARAGISAQQSMVALPQIVDLATTSELEFAQAASIATESVAALGMFSGDAAVLGRNLNTVIDLLAKTSTSSNATMETLAETVSEAGPTMEAAGVATKDFFSATALLARSGIKGQRAGRALRNMMLSLAAPTKETQRLFRKIRFSAVDPLTGEFKGMGVILDELNKSLGGLTKAQRIAALESIFQRRQVSTISILLKAGAAGLANYREEIDKSTGANKRMAAIMRDTLEKRFLIFISAVESLQQTIFDLNNTAFNALIDKATEVIRKFELLIQSNDEYAQSISENLIDVIVGGMGTFIEFLAIFVLLEITTVALSLSMTALSIALGAVTLAFGVLVKLKIFVFFKWLAIVVGGLVVAFLGVPTAIFLGVVALIILVAVAVRKLAGFGDKVTGIIDGIKDKWRGLVNFVKNLPFLGSDGDFLEAPLRKFSKGIRGMLKNVKDFQPLVTQAEAAETQGLRDFFIRTGRFSLDHLDPLNRITHGANEEAAQERDRGPALMRREETISTNRLELTVRDPGNRINFSGNPGPAVNLKLLESGAFE